MSQNMGSSSQARQSWITAVAKALALMASKRLDIRVTGGISPDPQGLWMEQLARHLTDPVEGFRRHSTKLIHDRDPLFTQRFHAILSAAGVKPFILPTRSPDLNAYAERFVKSIRSEYLEEMIFLGEVHLQRTITQYLLHCHRERNYQGVGLARVVSPTRERQIT